MRRGEIDKITEEGERIRKIKIERKKKRGKRDQRRVEKGKNR